ncbi:MAG TPA: YbhB/YbcL family Raf kinase inhibitor-like protein [Gammaproteobacteria bacterium]
MAENFSVRSPQLREGARIADEQLFNKYGCHGANLSPALEWRNPPGGTRSFAVTVYDLDVPSGADFWHWLIFNIPANTTHLAKGAGDPQAHLAPPGAIQSRNDFGAIGYGGPCPPPGDKPHRYEFTVYALRCDKLDELDEHAQAATVSFYLQENMLSKAVLRATYSR